MLLLIDNYDSFTYNLAHYLSSLQQDIQVVRNDAISLAEINRLQPSHIVISPGPGRPSNAGICLAVVAEFASHIPILGVCLGHQCIVQAFGGRVMRATQVMHGKTSSIYHDNDVLFESTPNPLTVTRYHSLVAAQETLPNCLDVIAWTQQPDGMRAEIMAVRHQEYPTVGVQFHPEAILTEYGHQLLENFLLSS